MCKSIKPEPTVDEHLTFRWWTYGALILYTASLLVLCGFVTTQKYSLADSLNPAVGRTTAPSADRTLSERRPGGGRVRDAAVLPSGVGLRLEVSAIEIPA